MSSFTYYRIAEGSKGKKGKKMKPSPYTEINQSIVMLMSFIKDNVKTGVVQYCRDENIDVSDGELRRIVDAVERQIDASFTNGYSNVQKCLSSLDIK